HGDQVEGGVGEREPQGVGLENDGRTVGDFAARRDQHGMAEIGAVDQPSTAHGEGQQQVAGPAAQVQHARAGPAEDLRKAPRGARPPVSIQLKGKQMIEQVIAPSYASEHAADPARGLFLAGRAGRRGAPRGAHSRAFLSASSIRLSSRPETTSVLPMAVARTKWTAPRMVFLSDPRRASRRSGERSAAEGMGPYKSTESTIWRVTSGLQRRASRDSQAAAFMPSPTASPCR